MTEIQAEAIANKPMEGGGFYNRNSNLQAAGIELVMPLFEAAAAAVPVPEDPAEPVVIADYGASQGRNSLRPMGVAIDVLRPRIGAERPIQVVHTDLPGNDFASLFTTLQDDRASYLSGRPRVFPSAVGRSYFEPILPPGHVHLGWNSWTLHWLSRSPVQVDDHASAILSPSSAARDAVRRQAAQDWTSFLAARSGEMAPGARLVSLFMGATPEVHGWDWIIGELWQVALEMAAEGLVTWAELTRFTIPATGRTQADLTAAFVAGPLFGLSLERAEVIEGPDPFWDDYLQSRDAEAFGQRWEGMMRAVCSGIAAEAFAGRPDGDALAEALFRRMGERVALAPRRHQHFIAVAVVRKDGN